MTYEDIDKMTGNEWLNYRDSLLESFYADGKELVANPYCKQCDVDFDNYVCFDCECMQIEKWRSYRGK